MAIVDVTPSTPQPGNMTNITNSDTTLHDVGGAQTMDTSGNAGAVMGQCGK